MKIIKNENDIRRVIKRCNKNNVHSYCNNGHYFKIAGVEYETLNDELRSSFSSKLLRIM